MNLFLDKLIAAAAQTRFLGRHFIVKLCHLGAHEARRLLRTKTTSKKDCLCAFLSPSSVCHPVSFSFFYICAAHSLSPEVENLK